MVVLLLQALHATETQKKILDSRSGSGMTRKWKDCCDTHMTSLSTVDRGRP
jgi:hypothetical protein